MGTGLGVRRGLTLIELLVTVTVLSIAVALVIPSVSQTGVLRVQAAVRTVASDIANAQTEAMAYQTRRALYFGAVASDDGAKYEAGNGYVVVEPTGETLGIDSLQDYVLFMPEEQGRPFVRDFSDSRFGGAQIVEAEFNGEPYLVFDELGGPLSSLGSLEPGSGGTITIEALQYGIAYEISVEGMTGRVDVEAIDTEPEAPPVADDDDSGELETHAELELD